MKKIFKIFSILLIVTVLSGCMGSMGPSEKTEEMLNRYIKNDQSIMDELDEYIGKQDLTEEQKERYKDIIKNEYSSIKYEIKNETIDGDAATVEVSIEVKDLYKASNVAEDYLIEHPTEFYTDGVYDASKFVDYKLGVMEKSTDTVTYTIYVNLIKKDNIWTIEELDDTTLEKIHGIYNYES